ncbi:response to drug-related protein [Pseudohyphozyma bogoriensis]|nr:response to drug-related protein [Pseudohyphozyma bogoriensis]
MASPKPAQQQSSRRRVERVGFSDSRLADARKALFKSFWIVLLGTTVFMWICLPVYWGTYYRQEENLQRLGVGIIDLDTPACAAVSPARTPTLGPALTSLAQAQLSSSPYHLGYEILDTTQFDLSTGTGGSPRGVVAHEWAEKAVLNEDYFGIIIVSANATLLAVDTFGDLMTGATPAAYDGSGALRLYWDESRSFDTVDEWVGPGMTNLTATAIPMGAAALFSQLMQIAEADFTQAEYAAVDQSALASVLAVPFGQSTYNLRPLNAYAGIAATTIGMIYLLIFTFLVTAAWNGARMAVEPRLKLSHLIALRLLVPITGYLFISLSVALISVAFGVPFDNYYTKGGFVIFWMMLWVTQVAMGLMMELALTLLGPQYTAFFLIFWVILNVSTAFLDLGDLANFYSYGFIMPAWNAVSAAKSIAFGTKNHLVQNFAVNIGWIIVGLIALPLTVAWQRGGLIETKRREKLKTP